MINCYYLDPGHSLDLPHLLEQFQVVLRTLVFRVSQIILLSPGQDCCHSQLTFHNLLYSYDSVNFTDVQTFCC